MNARNVYVITGGSSGIGLAIAKEASKLGEVLIVARDERKLQLALKELAPGKHSYLAVDLSIAGQAKRAVDEAVTRYGRLDGLVNNAGDIVEKPFTKQTMDEFRRVFSLNFLAAVEASHAALAYMERQKAGVIVNMSSMAGLKNYPNESAYGSSKAALNKFTEQLRLEYKPPIHVFAVAPGSIDTPGLRNLLDPQRAVLEKEVFKTFTLDQYYGKILKPSDVGERVADLLKNPTATKDTIVQMKSYEF